MGSAMPKRARAEDDAPKERKFVTAVARGLEVLRAFGAGDRQLGNQGDRAPHRAAEAHRLAAHLHAHPPRLPALLRGGREVRARQRRARPRPRRAGADGRPAHRAPAHAGARGAHPRLGEPRHPRPARDDVHRHVPERRELHGPARRGLARPHRRLVDGPRLARGPPRARAQDGARRAPRRRPRGLARGAAGIEQALRDYEARGFCMSLGEWRREVHAVASPLVSPDGAEILVFSCSGAPFQFGREQLEAEVGPRLLTLVGNVRSALAAR